jgi:hypothetical protein
MELIANSLSSFEYGKAGKRHKIYYKDIKDLTTMILALKNLGLIDIELNFKEKNE